MAGLFIQRQQGSNTAAGASFISGSTTTTAGNTLALVVTYTGAVTSVTPDPTAIFGTWVEDASLRHASGSGVQMYVYTMNNCNAATGQLTVNFGASVTNRGIYMIEISGVDHYIAGVFPAYQVSPGSANDSITTGAYTVSGAASVPNYLTGFVWDQSGGGVTPSIGSLSVGLFVSESTGWLFGDSVSDARSIDARVITDGNVTATFTSSAGGTDTFASLLLAFAESASTYTIMSQCMY